MSNVKTAVVAVGVAVAAGTVVGAAVAAVIVAALRRAGMIGMQTRSRSDE